MSKQAVKTGLTGMSQKLQQLLAKEIEAMNERRKGRLVEIIGVFAKHNFYAGGLTPLELRTTLEDLGPTYVKIGQIMSSRVDMLPKPYCDELGTLRSNVKPMSAEVVRAAIEEETGKKIEEIYSEFSDKPLGSASIAQAHYGVLLDGTRVVTKVQRPLIGDMMREDFVLLKKLASLLGGAKRDDSTSSIDLKAVIDELAAVTEEELDFRVEAGYTRFFKENCIEDETKVSCPTIIDELTSEHILTMTYVDGFSVGKRDRIIENGWDPEAIGAAITENFVHQVLDVGTFHGDPHQGNIMVSDGVPYWIDFGMMGHLSASMTATITDVVVALVEQDIETLTNTVMTMGVCSPDTSRTKLSEDLDAFVGRYMSVTSLDDLDTAKLFGDLTDLCANNHIELPSEFTMLVRSIATIEGVIEELCPSLNLFKLISDKMMGRVKQSVDVKQLLLGAGKDSIAAGKKVAKIPSLINDALSAYVKGRSKVSVELTGYDAIMQKITGMFGNAVLAVFACVIFIGSCLLLLASCITTKTAEQLGTLLIVPMAGVFGLLISIALGIYTLRRIRKNK